MTPCDVNAEYSVNARTVRTTADDPVWSRVRACATLATAMDGSTPRVSISGAVLAGLLGCLAGLLTFAVSAALWRGGHFGAAGHFPEGMLLLALISVALVTLLAQPARMRRARVHVGRPLPHQWWPAQRDPLPALAACFAAPLAAGAGAALLLFR